MVNNRAKMMVNENQSLIAGDCCLEFVQMRKRIATEAV